MGDLSRACWVGLLALGFSVDVGSVEFSGTAAFDSRVFLEDPAFPGQRTDTYYPSFLLQPELRQEFNGGHDRLSLVSFGRFDVIDIERRHWDIRELNWQHVESNWDMKFGVGKVFWGVTESRHLVDIINQSDYLEDIDLKEKLGQPMFNLNYSGDYGTLSLFALPYFRERNFENRPGRFRPVIPIDTGQNKFDSSLGVWHPDLALRWSKAFGGWDMGLAHFWGTSREPRFDLNLADPLHPSLIPRYDIINQTSLDVQYTHGAWLWKLEAITRSGQYRRFQATVAGLEYTFFDLLHSGVNLGLLAEYLYDGRSQDVRQAPPTPYNNDIFLGLRLSLEDTQNTDLLMGLVQDLGSGAKFVNIEASRRFGSAWKVEMKARFFMDAPFQDFVLYGFHQDDYVQMRLGYYF